MKYLISLLFLSACSTNVVSVAGDNFFTNHSIFQLIGWLLFPRIMFWFFSVITGGFFFWLGVLFIPIIIKNGKAKFDMLTHNKDLKRWNGRGLTNFVKDRLEAIAPHEKYLKKYVPVKTYCRNVNKEDFDNYKKFNTIVIDENSDTSNLDMNTIMDGFSGEYWKNASQKEKIELEYEQYDEKISQLLGGIK